MLRDLRVRSGDLPRDIAVEVLRRHDADGVLRRGRRRQQGKKDGQHAECHRSGPLGYARALRNTITEGTQPPDGVLACRVGRDRSDGG